MKGRRLVQATRHGQAVIRGLNPGRAAKFLCWRRQKSSKVGKMTLPRSDTWKMVGPRTRCCLAAMLALVVTAYAQAQKADPAASPAWPQAAVADATKLGFTKTGLDALDARLKQAVADGDTAGTTYILIRHGQ